jgi:signal transduction histidine kinase
MLNTLRATTDNLVRAESFRAISRLSAGISHNLNNILTGILGPAEVIKTEPINEEVRTHIETIQRAATRAADLVR